MATPPAALALLAVEGDVSVQERHIFQGSSHEPAFQRIVSFVPHIVGQELSASHHMGGV